MKGILEMIPIDVLYQNPLIGYELNLNKEKVSQKFRKKTSKL